ncbi:MAG: glycosyltransferase family 2 protein [Magnetococcales bacterium]|nr:glycosyltransferase family 2 protein [Magnetococcales bacterium]
MSPESVPVILSLVVPCFNEAAVLPQTHRRIMAALGQIPGLELECIYVNDGSSDGTLDLLRELEARHPNVVVLDFSRNFGHQAAVTAGMDAACGEVVVIIDADLQDPPEVIPLMLEKWRQGYQVVYGVRTRRKESLPKVLAYGLFYRIMRAVANIDVPLDSGDFALLDRKVVEVMRALPENNRFVRGLRAWSGFRQTGLVYQRQERAGGESKYTLRKLLRLAMDGIFNFSTAPLSLIFLAGLFISTAAILAMLVIVVSHWYGFTLFGHRLADAPGFTSLILAILFFSGVQLISIGILGEYLGRVYQEVKRRPPYVLNSPPRPRESAAPAGPHCADPPRGDPQP